MYIHKIKLADIRGFDHLEFDLQRPDKNYAGWTVFTGDNGSGKSTLLRSIAQRLMSAPSTERFVTMFEEAASLAEVDRWLRELDRKKLEMKVPEDSQLAFS